MSTPKKLINYSDEAFQHFFMNAEVESSDVVYVNYTEEMLEAVASNMTLPEEIQAKYLTLLGSIGDLLEFTKANIIGEQSAQIVSVKFNDNVPERVYTPALFSKTDDDGVKHLVLKIGNNSVLVNQDGENFSVGDFKGSLDFVNRQTTDSTILNVMLRLKNATHTFVIPCVLPDKVDYTRDDIEVHIESGKGFAELLREVGSGQSFIKLRDLDEGLYPILDVLEPEGKMYGRFELSLAEGNVTPNAKLNKSLESYLAMCESFETFKQFFKTQSLRIISKEEKQDGRVFVNAVFVKNNAGQAKVLKPAKSEIVPMKSADAELVTADAYPI
jgi:hypothetical protein